MAAKYSSKQIFIGNCFLFFFFFCSRTSSPREVSTFAFCLKINESHQTKDAPISTYSRFQPNCVWQKSVISQGREEGKNLFFFIQSCFISLQYTMPIVFCVVKSLTMVQYCSWLSCLCLHTEYLWGRLLHRLCASIPHLERGHTTSCLFSW